MSAQAPEGSQRIHSSRVTVAAPASQTPWCSVKVAPLRAVPVIAGAVVTPGTIWPLAGEVTGAPPTPCTDAVTWTSIVSPTSASVSGYWLLDPSATVVQPPPLAGQRDHW